MCSMIFGPNDSPIAGKEGSQLTGSKIGERLNAEAETSVSLRVLPVDGGGESFEVQARGELQLGLLIGEARHLSFTPLPPPLPPPPLIYAHPPSVVPCWYKFPNFQGPGILCCAGMEHDCQESPSCSDGAKAAETFRHWSIIAAPYSAHVFGPLPLESHEVICLYCLSLRSTAKGSASCQCCAHLMYASTRLCACREHAARRI